MDCPEAKRGEVEVACPQDDSLVEIFSRLHAKPLFRFKCVSKDWCGLIADRLRCRKFPQTLAGFFSGGGIGEYGGFIDLLGRPVPLVDPSFSFLTKLPEIQKIDLLDSCNGLVLFGHRRVSDRYDTLGYIVCNPATEEWVPVPSSDYTPRKWHGSDSYYEDNQGKWRDGPSTYLIFDPAISPHFQLIQLRWELMHAEKVHTFSSVTGTWTFDVVPGLEPDLATFNIGGFVGCPFNGMLHVRANQRQENRNMILVVGGETRPFRTLHWPQNDRGVIVFVGQSQGHLHCVSGCKIEDSQMSPMTELSIWVLEDYNTEKWVLRDNVSLTQLFKRTRGYFLIDWNVVGIHPDRGLVFIADYQNCRLISYDMDTKEVHALCSLHGDAWHIPYVPYFAQSAALAKKR